MDVLEAAFQEFGYLDTDLSGKEVYQELINTEDMIVSKTDDSVNGFTTAYGPEIFASKESRQGMISTRFRCMRRVLYKRRVGKLCKKVLDRLTTPW